MNSNVLFQISTIVLALALAAVLIVVYVIPEEESYVKHNVNEGLIEVDEFDIVDEYSRSSTKGRLLVVNDGEFKIKLIADITVAQGDFGGFRATFDSGVVVDRLYCEFNGDIEETEVSGYSLFYYSDYIKGGQTTIVVDSSELDVTGKHKPGSGMLVVDLKMDPKKSIDGVDTVECFIGIGSRTSPEGYRILNPAYEKFFLPTKDANKEEKGGYYKQDAYQKDLRISDSIEPVTVRFDGPGLTLKLSPSISAVNDNVFSFVPDLVIPAGQGKFRSLRMSFGVEPFSHSKILSATYTDLEAMDPKAYAYGSRYYLGKGAAIESDELRFTDSRTFTFDKDLDHGDVSVSIVVEMAQEGRVNTYSKMLDFHLSRSGVFYDIVDYWVRGHAVDHPTDGDMVDFKRTVESGNVVRIWGDYTEISKLARLDTAYDPKSVLTAAIYVSDEGATYSKAFYNDGSLATDLDAWATSVLAEDAP
ncbi:MAG: hypothetical protein IKQ60_09910 [Candidatus Methanomethylophilaceae archaeon]|nr:hypothetical protein [Candidatus Methanomethylophilaceae archaeon]